MSKKKLGLLIVAILVVIVPIAAYIKVNYDWAQNSLVRARLEVRTLGERLERRDPPEKLTEAYKLAKFQVDQAANHSTWIKRDEIDALEKTLEQYKQDLDRIEHR